MAVAVFQSMTGQSCVRWSVDAWGKGGRVGRRLGGKKRGERIRAGHKRERKRKERRQDWWADEQRRRLRTAEGEKQNEARKSRVEWPLSRGCSIAHHRAQATAPHRMSGWRRSGGQSASEQREREGEEESLLPLFRSAAAHAVVAGGRCLRGTRSIGVPCASAAPFPSLLPTPKYGAERRDTRSIG